MLQPTIAGWKCECLGDDIGAGNGRDARIGLACVKRVEVVDLDPANMLSGEANGVSACIAEEVNQILAALDERQR